jgi:mRNA interferase MazF
LAEGLTRGDVLVASAPGEYGKPRPCIVVQSEMLHAIESVVVCPMTTSLLPPGPVRPTILPSVDNGLRAESQVMVDKVTAIHLSRCGPTIGRVSSIEMQMIDQALGLVLGLRIQPRQSI